jgi:hypothetical protein
LSENGSGVRGGAVGFRKKRQEEGAGEIMKTAVEVASVKAQVEGIVLRMRRALDELEETMDGLPERKEVVLDDDAAAGTDATHRGADPEG